MDQADGLCLLLNQIKKSLRVLDFRHCRLSQDKLSKIHVSLMVDGADSHLLNHLFVISSSTFFEDTTASSQFMKVLHANRYEFSDQEKVMSLQKDMCMGNCER